MVPAKIDPKWRRFLANLSHLQPEHLATRMLVSRLKLKIAINPSEATNQEAIDVAFEFFSKNETAVAADIRRIFG